MVLYTRVVMTIRSNTYQEDVNRIVVDMMNIIDKQKGFDWSDGIETDQYYDKFESIVIEIFGYPEYNNEN